MTVAPSRTLFRNSEGSIKIQVPRRFAAAQNSLSRSPRGRQKRLPKFILAVRTVCYSWRSREAVGSWSAG